MKSALVLMVLTAYAFSICYGMTKSLVQKPMSKYAESEPAREENFEEFIVSLIPLRIVLEHKLRDQDEENIPLGKEIKFEEMKSRRGNLKSLPEMHNQPELVCDKIRAFKNISAEELQKMLSKDSEPAQHLRDVEQMEEIYHSLRNCYFMKVHNEKLWGPLWHCLNRLFLYFVFH